MPLCFIEPQDAIRVIAESVGREARRQLVGEVVRAWVDDIPDQELSVHYAKAIADLDETLRLDPEDPHLQIVLSHLCSPTCLYSHLADSFACSGRGDLR